MRFVYLCLWVACRNDAIPRSPPRLVQKRVAQQASLAAHACSGLLGLFLKLPSPVSAFRIPLNRRAAAAAGAEPLCGPFQSGAMPHASRRCVSMGSMLAPAGTTVAPSARTSATVRGAAAT